MALESSFNYISDLSASNPAAGDDPVQGDDHLRGIKNVLLTTFTGGASGLSGAVTASHTELNLLDNAVAKTVVNSKAVIYGSAGEVNATTLQIGGVSITASAAELNLLDNAAAGTVVNSKAVIYNAAGQVKATTFSVGPPSSGQTVYVVNVAGESAIVTTDGTCSTLIYSDGANGSLWGNTSNHPLSIRTNNLNRLTISAAGDVSLAGDQIGIDTAQTPANAGATGVKGTICWDADFIYVCVDTNTWKRAAIATWP